MVESSNEPTDSFLSKLSGARFDRLDLSHLSENLEGTHNLMRLENIELSEDAREGVGKDIVEQCFIAHPTDTRARIEREGKLREEAREFEGRDVRVREEVDQDRFSGLLVEGCTRVIRGRGRGLYSSGLSLSCSQPLFELVDFGKEQLLSGRCRGG
jgi:hypothetical protein